MAVRFLWACWESGFGCYACFAGRRAIQAVMVLLTCYGPIDLSILPQAAWLAEALRLTAALIDGLH